MCEYFTSGSQCFYSAVMANSKLVYSINLAMDSLVDSITVTRKQTYCTEMMKRFNTQRRNELFCDVILEVGSGDDQARLKAHRNVLCASPFFCNDFDSDMKEKKEGVIRLEEMSKASMEEVLDCLYTGHVEIVKENANHHLFAQADYFLMPRLKALSSKFTHSSLKAIVDTAEYRTEMMKSLDIQRKSGHFCDVILEVGSGNDQARLKAHRNVLCAASPFFYNALNSDMKEKKEGVIRLEETTATLMEEVLDFLYTGYVEVTDEENAFELFQHADYLLIPSLKALSSKFILQILDISNCIMVYNFAILYQHEELQNAAKDFILANFVAVAGTEDFLNLSSKEIEQWIQSDKLIIKEEEEVFQVILKWMENGNDEDIDFLQLLRHVRCIYLSSSYVFSVILQHPLVKASTACTEFVLDAMKEVANGTDECFFSQPPRDCLKTHEDAIIACGTKTTLCFLPSGHECYFLPDVPSEHHPSTYSMGSLYGKLLIIGGYTNPSSSVVECFDPTHNQWASAKAPEIVKNCTAAVTLKGFLYVVGGFDNSNQPISTVQKYNPDTNQWQEVSSLSSPRSNVCGVSDGSYLYAIGGFNVNGRPLKIVERFNPRNNTWNRLPSTLAMRSGACGAAIRQKVFVFGGLSKRSKVGSPSEMYDPDSNTWSDIASEVAPRNVASAVSFKGTIYVLGICQNEHRREHRSFYVYNVDKNEWKHCNDFDLRQDTTQCFQISALRISRDVLKKCRMPKALLVVN